MKGDVIAQRLAAFNASLEEVCDAFVIVGYKAGSHERFVAVNPGTDPACHDGLREMVEHAEEWQAQRPPGGA